MDLDEPHSPQAAAGASVSAPRTPPRASAGAPGDCLYTNVDKQFDGIAQLDLLRA